MSEKCFCHLNGLAVKDATARRELQDKVSYSELTQAMGNVNNSVQNLAFRQTELERQVSGLVIPGNAEELSFANSGTGLAAENTQHAIVEVNQKLDAVAGIVSELEEGSTVRVVRDEADENFGWIQYKDADGNWINWEQAITTNYPLYMSTENEGGFEAYAGKIAGDKGNTVKAPTVNFGTTMDVSFATPNYGDSFVGCVVSEIVDLSRYDKLFLTHTTTTNIGNGSEGYVKVFVTNAKGNTMNAATTMLLTGSGDVEIDLSNVSGEYYIAVEVYLYCTGMQNDKVETKISNMYLE